MKILVLGASGFIGSWVVRALNRQGASSGALVRKESSLWRISGVEGIEVHAADEDEWTHVISEVKPDVIISLDWAGVAGSHRDDQAQWQNLARQNAVLTAAAAAGVRRFVGVGSQAEYGPKTEIIAESSLPAPRTEYGKAKLAAMESGREFCAARGMEWVWARVFSIFGPLDNGHWLLPMIADSLLAETDIALTAGDQRWSYLYGADAATALATLATHQDAAGIYNLGNPDAPALRESVQTFAAHFQTSARVLFGALPYGEGAVMRLEPNVSRLTALGWSPLVSIATGMGLTARWLRGDEVVDPLSPNSVLPMRFRHAGRERPDEPSISDAIRS